MGQAPQAAGHDSDWFWNLYARVYDSVYHLIPYRKLLWDVYRALELQPGMRVLDAGCGTGNFEFFISQKNPPHIEIDAVDFSTGMLRVAEKKCRDLDYVDFKWGDLTAPLPYADDTFDRIVSINVLFALPDWDHAMSEFLRVLKPEGTMVLTSNAVDYSFVPLVADHFRRVGNIWGASRKARTILKTARVMTTSALGSVILNTLVINRRESKGEYRGLDHAALRSFLERHRLSGLGEFSIGRALADQNLLATAVKAAQA